ncbi:MAG: hypothetical protein JSV05_00315 [Candidatus Bathyarchaeota archaeon]|nr:MAG: hypothetical protein JSV05_00315 [Candidatus Bathyarchaeota archaeon]
MDWKTITQIDRRYLYIILFIFVSIPLLSPLNLPILVGEHAQAMYDTTETLSAGDIVVCSFDFGPATIPENRPQAKGFLFQARELGLRVVATAFWASGGPLGEDILRDVYGSDFPAIPEYGTDVVYLGYIPGNEVGMQTFGDDTWTAKGTDHYGTPMADIPLMQDTRAAEDLSLWCEITSGTPGEQQVIQFVQGRHGGPAALPLVVGSTAVSVPGMMPFYAAGQIVGILNGLSGAGEYESLLAGAYGYPTELLAPLDAQSVAHVIVILFIIAGNISYVLTRSSGGKEK